MATGRLFETGMLYTCSVLILFILVRLRQTGRGDVVLDVEGSPDRLELGTIDDQF